MKVIQTTRFLYGNDGHFCIEVNGKRSSWQSHQSVASLVYDNRIFIGFTQFHNNIIPLETEQVYEVSAIPKVTEVVRDSGSKSIFMEDMAKLAEECRIMYEESEGNGQEPST